MAVSVAVGVGPSDGNADGIAGSDGLVACGADAPPLDPLHAASRSATAIGRAARPFGRRRAIIGPASRIDRSAGLIRRRLGR
jgi:hypothetical protein